MFKSLFGIYLKENNETTLNRYKNQAHILIGSSRDAIDEKVTIWKKEEEQLTKKLQKYYNKHKEIRQDYKREIESVRNKIRAIINSKYNLKFSRSEVKFAYTKEDVDDIIDKDLEYIKYLSANFGVLSKEFLEMYREKIEKLHKLTIAMKSEE